LPRGLDQQRIGVDPHSLRRSKVGQQLPGPAADFQHAVGKGSAEAVIAEGRQTLEAAGFRIDYLEVRDAETLKAPQPGRPKRVLVAAWLGKTRLIDNVAA
jgi:pantoate--beta-alanine ligase